MWRGEGVGKKEKSPRIKMEKRELKWFSTCLCAYTSSHVHVLAIVCNFYGSRLGRMGNNRE